MKLIGSWRGRHTDWARIWWGGTGPRQEMDMTRSLGLVIELGQAGQREWDKQTGRWLGRGQMRAGIGKWD